MNNIAHRLEVTIDDRCVVITDWTMGYARVWLRPALKWLVIDPERVQSGGIHMLNVPPDPERVHRR